MSKWKDMSPFQFNKLVVTRFRARWHKRLMKTKSPSAIRVFFPICFVAFLVSSDAICQEKNTSEWHARSLPFRVLNATNSGSSLWVCGTDEAVAVSTDAGEHWQVRPTAPDGAALLN